MRLLPTSSTRIRRTAVFVVGFAPLAFSFPTFGREDAIGEVRLDKAAFNPSAGQAVELGYRLAGTERISIHIYDPDDGWVRTLVDAEERPAGDHAETWDGRDVDGRIVPDEAYYFVIETATGEVWDPKTFSGGEVGHVKEIDLDRDGGTLGYRLPTSARVLCRLGIHNGPMLRTLVDWKPRVAGVITEYWQGWDEDGVVEFANHPKFSMLVTWVALPDASVIAFGNRETTYREVKLEIVKDRPKKPERPRVLSDEIRLHPTGLVPPAWARAPEVTLTFVEADDSPGVPEVGDRVRVRVEADTIDHKQLENDPYEILFFVDNIFFAEAERGYSPLNWIWETHQLPPGEHILTVNLSSTNGQVGVASRKVRVRPRE